MNSRYYNLEWGRFLNVDIIIGSNDNIFGYNLYNYAGNNPINNCDYSGNFWKKIGEFITNGVENVMNLFSNDSKKTESKQSPKNVKKATNTNINNLPTKDVPNTTKRKPNGDLREYGPDGKATKELIIVIHIIIQIYRILILVIGRRMKMIDQQED